MPPRLQQNQSSQQEQASENESESPSTDESFGAEESSAENEEGSEEGEEENGTEDITGVPKQEVEVITREDIELLSRSNRGMVQQNAELKRQIEELAKSLQPKPEAPRRVTQEDFNDNAADAMDRMLEEKLNKAIGPIRERFERDRKQQDFSDTFESVIADLNPAWPQFKDALMPEVKKFLGTLDPTSVNIKTATLLAVGNAFASGQFNGSAPVAPVNNNNNNNQPKTIPPNSKNTNRAPVTDGKKPNLTESMRKNMYRSGFEDGQEQDFIDSLGSEEITFDALAFLKKKDKGKK